MLEFIDNLPDNVIGIYAKGEVTQDEIQDKVRTRLSEMKNQQGEINYLLVLETDVQNFTLKAWWEEFKTGLHNFSDWYKIAIVTDQKTMEWLADSFKFFIPGKSKGFAMDEIEEAKKWIAE